MKLRVRGKRGNISLDVIWNEKQTPSKGHSKMSADDAWGRGFSCQLCQDWVRTQGRAYSIGCVLSYTLLLLLFHCNHPDLVLLTTFLVLQLLSSSSSSYLLIYHTKHYWIIVLFLKFWEWNPEFLHWATSPSLLIFFLFWDRLSQSHWLLGLKLQHSYLGLLECGGYRHVLPAPVSNVILTLLGVTVSRASY